MEAKKGGASFYYKSILAPLALTVLGLGISIYIYIYIERERERIHFALRVHDCYQQILLIGGMEKKVSLSFDKGPISKESQRSSLFDHYAKVGCIVPHRYSCRSSNTVRTFLSKYACDIKFDFRQAKMLRKILANRTVTFVGDSLGGQQQVSFACLLKEEYDQVSYSGVIYNESQHDEKGNPGRHTKYNVAFPNGLHVNFVFDKYLDVFWKYMSFNDGDIVVLNTGAWWSNTKTPIGRLLVPKVMSCFSRDSNQRQNCLDIVAKNMTTIVSSKILGISKVLSTKRVIPIFRLPDYYHLGGPGHCLPDATPFGEQFPMEKVNNDQKALRWIDHQLYSILKTEIPKYSNEGQLKLMDISDVVWKLNTMHPGPYIDFHNKTGYDCRHWCQPGVPDEMNYWLFSYLIDVLNSK